ASTGVVQPATTASTTLRAGASRPAGGSAREAWTSAASLFRAALSVCRLSVCLAGAGSAWLWPVPLAHWLPRGLRCLPATRGLCYHPCPPNQTRADQEVSPHAHPGLPDPDAAAARRPLRRQGAADAGGDGPACRPLPPDRRGTPAAHAERPEPGLR